MVYHRQLGLRQTLRRSAGFTLIEIMIVVVIVMILFGMTLSTLSSERAEAEVQREAERLASVLRNTRNRAIAEGKAYGVAFNITNGRNTSGAILNNWDQGHWYRVIGPDRGRHENAGGLPLAGTNAEGDLRNNFEQELGSPNFPDFLANVAESWVSQPYVLPGRQVRFLALSDTDEGPRQNSESVSDRIYYTETYPRPWFGYYDQAAEKLWPWGGYDSSLDYSGFYYEGDSGDVSNSVNPDTRTRDNDFNRDNSIANVDINSDTDTDDLREQEREFTIWQVGEARPLINADWMDACLMFTASGEARFIEWCRGRRAYKNEQASSAALAVGTKADDIMTDRGRNGVADRAKQIDSSETYNYHNHEIDSENSPPRWNYQGPTWDLDIDNGGVSHFTRHTGGYHITLAPDALDNGVDGKFGSAQEALDSIDPAWRVYVGRHSGVVATYRVKRQGPGWANGLSGSPWPNAVSDWQRPNLVFRNCRAGWLHDTEANWMPISHLFDNEDGLRGQPITDRVSEEMLMNKIWWTD